MKTLVARRGTDQPVLAEVATPQQLDAGDVRVAVAAAAFTYSTRSSPPDREALGLPEQVGLGFDFGTRHRDRTRRERVHRGRQGDRTARRHHRPNPCPHRRARDRSRPRSPPSPTDSASTLPPRSHSTRSPHARRSTYSGLTAGACW